jgi:hypothetical protein
VFGDLQQALDSQLAAKGAVLTVRLDQWPLDVSTATCCTPASPAPPPRPSPPARARPSRCPSSATAPTGLVELREETAGTGRVFVQHAGITPSGRYLASAITPLARKINVDKAVQGRAGAGFDCDFLCYIATETPRIYPRRA